MSETTLNKAIQGQLTEGPVNGWITLPDGGSSFAATAHPISGTEAEVCVDISSRQQIGLRKYRTSVMLNPLSLRAWLEHGYEECLDQAIYLKRAINKLEAAKPVDDGLASAARKAGALCEQIEKCTASAAQTDASLLAADLASILRALAARLKE